MSLNPINPIPNNKMKKAINVALQDVWPILMKKSSVRLSRDMQAISEASSNYVKSPYYCVFGAFLFNIKRILKQRNDYEARIAKKDHVLTDHAFCRILELICGVDVIEEKNKAISALNASSEYYPFSINGQIVTIKKDIAGE
jgi:hypothetical protein